LQLFTWSLWMQEFESEHLKAETSPDFLWTASSVNAYTKALYEGGEHPRIFNCVIKSTLDGRYARVNKYTLSRWSPVVRNDPAFSEHGGDTYTVDNVPGVGLEALVRLEYVGEVRWLECTTSCCFSIFCAAVPHGIHLIVCRWL
jgi:hypothetical protein